LLPQA